MPTSALETSFHASVGRNADWNNPISGHAGWSHCQSPLSVFIYKVVPLVYLGLIGQRDKIQFWSA